VVDASTVLATDRGAQGQHVRSSRSTARFRSSLKQLPKEQGELVKDIVPSQITVSGIQRVLQILLTECIFGARSVDHPGGHGRRPRLYPTRRRPSPSIARSRGPSLFHPFPAAKSPSAGVGRDNGFGFHHARDAMPGTCRKASCFRNETNNDIWWKHLRATIVNHSI
jgi:hypothetical protein